MIGAAELSRPGFGPGFVWAHTGESEAGVAVEWLLIGGALVIVSAILLRSSPSSRGVPIGIGVLGVALIAGAFALPRLGGDEHRPDARLRIVAPEADARVPAGEPIEVEVALGNAPLARTPNSEDGGHLHLYVDGQLQQMPYSKTAEVTLDAGRHELTVEYVDARHVSYDPPIQRSVEVIARDPG